MNNSCRLNSADIELLVEMDRANEDVCGPAIVHLLQRAFSVYGDQRYERLSKLAVSHLYNLRKSGGYRALRIHFTKPCATPLGCARHPDLMDVLAGYALTACIRETWTASRGSTTSNAWMRQASGRCRPVCRAATHLSNQQTGGARHAGSAAGECKAIHRRLYQQLPGSRGDSDSFVEGFISESLTRPR